MNIIIHSERIGRDFAIAESAQAVSIVPHQGGGNDVRICTKMQTFYVPLRLFVRVDMRQTSHDVLPLAEILAE